MECVLNFSGLLILQSNCGSLSHYGIFADKSTIPKGTRFGPFQGKHVNTSEIKTYDDNTLMWEVKKQMLNKYNYNLNADFVWNVCLEHFDYPVA